MRGKRRDDMGVPTPEQLAGGRFDIEDTHDKLPGGRQITIGKAYRRKPMVTLLWEQGLFSGAEYRALSNYRHHAGVADRSPIADSLSRQRFGRGSSGPTVELLNACRIRDDCERAAGSLADILRAVILDDWSLSQWAIERFGAVDDCGRVKPRQQALALARIEIVVAAHRVEAELAA